MAIGGYLLMTISGYLLMVIRGYSVNDYSWLLY